MAWYQSEMQVAQQQQEWKKLIEKQKPTIAQLMNSEQFCNQLTKNGNIEVMEWVEKNHVFFFTELLNRSLVLPTQADSHDRKYKQPTKAINLVCSFLESISIPSSGLPTSSISGSMSCSMMGTGCKVSSPQIIALIIQKLFTLYSQNNPEDLHNTLIPGSFFRIFDCLNRLHSPILIKILKTTQQGKLEKLLEGHGKLEQIIDCIKKILIVPIVQNGVSNNLQMSINFSAGPSPSILPHPSAMSSGQPNYPFETKCRLLRNILDKVKNYQKIDAFFLENLIAVLLEILRNPGNIFEGSMLTDYISQTQNINIFFDIGLGSVRQDGTECQSKCLELLKFCLPIIGIVDRQKIYPKIKLTIQKIMGHSKPTIVMNLMLDVINEWFLAESNQVGLNRSVNRSMGSSMSNSFHNSEASLPAEVEELLIGQNFFKFLLKMCVANPSYNIFHYKVTHFFVSVLKSQSVAIINSMYKDDEIMKETVTNMKDYKGEGHFGYFMVIIHNYTIHRINSPVVNEVLQKEESTWTKFNNEIFLPHIKNRIDNALGEMPNVTDPPPLQFIVTKMDQNRGEKQKKQDDTISKIKPVDKKVTVQAEALPISLDLDRKDSDKSKIENQKQSDAIQPISLPFSKKQQESKQQKSQTESFQSFLKKKMGENNKLVDERRKSRTPTKLITGESKRKKWGTQNEEDLAPTSAKKSVSADQKIPKPATKQQIIQKISFLKLSKTCKPVYPSQARERKINQQCDSNLLKWLQRSKNQAKRVR